MESQSYKDYLNISQFGPYQRCQNFDSHHKRIGIVVKTNYHRGLSIQVDCLCKLVDLYIVKLRNQSIEDV